MPVGYAVEAEIGPQEFVDILRRSGLAERRPVDQPDRVRRMVENADLLVCARDGGLLVGVSRALTDYAFCCYLSDLAVDRAYQGQGIGRELIRRTHAAAGLECTLLLLSAPAVMAYYPKVGMRLAGNAWVVDGAGRPKPDTDTDAGRAG